MCMIYLKPIIIYIENIILPVGKPNSLDPLPNPVTIAPEVKYGNVLFIFVFNILYIKFYFRQLLFFNIYIHYSTLYIHTISIFS